MSDSSGGSFGEALESMTTNTKKAVGGTIADFTKSAANQVKGTTGVSGSFTPGQAPANPNSAPSLSGGDLFSPDMAGKMKPQGQAIPQQAQAHLGQGPSGSQAKTPEEMAKIQSIQAELQSMHQKYYQEFLAKAEGRDRKTQIEAQEKQQEEKEKQMEDLQKKEEKKQQDQTVFRQQRGSEIKGGMG